MIITEHTLVEFINTNDNPILTEFFGIDVQGLDKFVMPETDLLSLIMLAKARDQGLDVVFVDEEKFFDGSFGRIIGTLRNGLGPFEGAWYIDFELSQVLLHGKPFCLNDYSEPMGYGVTLGAENLTNELINHFLDGTGKSDYGNWQEEGVKTIAQLADYINRMLTVPEPKANWRSRVPKPIDILTGSIVIIIAAGMGVHYVYKRGKHYYNSLVRRSK